MYVYDFVSLLVIYTNIQLIDVHGNFVIMWFVGGYGKGPHPNINIGWGAVVVGIVFY